MPPSDYKHLVEHAGVFAVVGMGFRARIRAWWSRIRHRDGVEGHRVL